MSPVLAMILAAAVTANGPEMVSGETERGLDLSGEWEGVLWNYYGVRSRFRWRDGGMVAVNDQMREVMGVRASFADQGEGKLRLRLDDRVYLGIYRQDGDLITVCASDKQRPMNFRLTKTQAVITLRRVRPRK